MVIILLKEKHQLRNGSCLKRKLIVPVIKNADQLNLVGMAKQSMT
jgi:pyruvate/2-oxoglutarate dehydrogenase complex dihydrolipoamide acyltransferase (E2) component